MSAPKEKITKGAATRAKILEVALKLISKNGFWATSIQMIADKVGLSQASVFVHFNTKESLLEALRIQVGQHNQQYVDATINMADSADKALFKHCMANIAWTQEFPERSQIIILHYYLGAVHDNHKKINQAIYSGGRDRILRYLLAGQREGLFEFSQKPEILADLIQDFLISQFIRASTSGGYQERTVQTRLKFFLNSCLHIRGE